MLDEWFPCIEDKEPVYALVNQMEPFLNSSEFENLQLWKMKNPIE